MANARLVAHLTWDAVRDATASGAPAVLPIGAGSKQHAFHLPLSTDAIQAEWFADRAAEYCGGLVFPALTYGFYPAFADYPGSITLRQETFQAVVRDLVDDLLDQVHSFVLVVDAGISTIEPAKLAISQTKRPDRVRYAAIYCGANFMSVRETIMEQSSGGHADEIETSVMLAIESQRVDMARAEPPTLRRARAEARLDRPFDPALSSFEPSGADGDPTLASLEKGRELVSAILSDIRQVCGETAGEL